MSDRITEALDAQPLLFVLHAEESRTDFRQDWDA